MNSILSGVIKPMVSGRLDDSKSILEAPRVSKIGDKILIQTDKQLREVQSYLNRAKVECNKPILLKNKEWNINTSSPLSPDNINDLYKMGVQITTSDDSNNMLPPRQDLKDNLPKSPRGEVKKPPGNGIQSCDLTDKFCCSVTCNSTKKTIRAYSFDEGITKDKVKISLNSDDWVFTQATAVASVNLLNEQEVTPATIQFVNNNSNAWSTDILNKYYNTFVGAHNYKDHIQEERVSRGVILDAIPRTVQVKGKDDNTENVTYVDCLIATNKSKWPEWAEAIESGNIKFLSVGCVASSLKCSKCGNIIKSGGDDTTCSCLTFERGMEYFDNQGNKSRVAELVTDLPDEDEESYLEFIELSYLSVNPAFAGAIQSHIINVEPNTDVSLIYPRETIKKSAFQVWKSYIQGID